MAGGVGNTLFTGEDRETVFMIDSLNKKIVIIVVCLLISMIFFSSLVIYSMRQPVVTGDHVIEIIPGDSLKSIGMKLKENCVVGYWRWWVVYGRIAGFSREIHAGEYLIPDGSSGRDIFALFVGGKTLQHKMTFTAGMTMSDVLETVTVPHNIVNDLEGREGKLFLKFLSEPYKDLEGLLYPDTYFYTAGARVSSVLQQSREALAQVLHEAWENRAPDLPYHDPYEALIMASLIEKETGNPAERAMIAGVFVHRLKKGMRLQSDPTVIYGMGDDFKGNLTRKNLRENTPYNTYRIKSLPPTPIALVTKESIQAALHPVGDALYFVAKGDGSHAFSKTLAEQRQAINRYQLKRRSDYSSSPRAIADDRAG